MTEETTQPVLQAEDSAIFVEIDVQDDFILHTGALSVKPPEHIVTNMKRLIESAEILIGSVDSHDYDSWEFNTNNNKGPDGEDPQFPPHCVLGTPGWLRTFHKARANVQFVPATAKVMAIHKFTDTVFLQKENYSLFTNPFVNNVIDWASEQLANTNNVVVFGVATDYCVKAACNGFLAIGYNVFLVDDAVWGVVREDHFDTMDELLKKGVKLIPTALALHKFAS